MGLIADILSALFAPPKQYGTLSVTVRGEEVKSHGEQKIADFLTSNGIRYEYEHPFEVGIWIFTDQLSRPDFYLPDYGVYIEYWGMVDVADERKRREYVRAMRWKLAKYHEYGVKVVSLYPSNLGNLDWVFRRKFKDLTGVELPRSGRSRTSYATNECQGAPRQVETTAETSGQDGASECGKRCCPECGGALKLRTARSGFNRGKQFWGCANYRRGRYILRDG